MVIYLDGIFFSPKNKEDHKYQVLIILENLQECILYGKLHLVAFHHCNFFR
jgi:hypothetical protein